MADDVTLGMAVIVDECSLDGLSGAAVVLDDELLHLIDVTEGQLELMDEPFELAVGKL